MSFQFPSSPADGTTFAPAGGPTYVYSGGVWKLAGGGSAFVVSSDTAPVAPFPGMLWFETDTGALYFWYVDANSSQWVQVNFTPSSGQTADARNRIVNPAMQISQEVGLDAPNSAPATYVADQWIINWATAGAPAQAVRQDTPPPNGNWFLRLGTGSTADASVAAGDYYAARQPLEGKRMVDFMWGTANAKPAVLRFQAKSVLAGTFCVCIRSDAGNAAFVKNCTIAANVWTDFTIPIPACTIGTWAITAAAWGHVSFTIMAGTNINGGTDGVWMANNFQATPACSNWMSVVGQNFEFTHVGLHLDPLATGLAPPWQMPDEAQELAACMRYWQQVITLFEGSVTSGSVFNSTGFVTVPPRGSVAISGVTLGQASFPATVGSLSFPSAVNWVTENRTASATAPRGYYRTTATVSSRM